MNTLQKKYDVVPVSFRDDEIDLVELARKIWQRKLWVVGTTFAFTVLAIAYAMLAKPTYKLEGAFRPVLAEQFTELNLAGVVEMTPEEAMNRFLRNLASRELRRSLFNQPEIGARFAATNKNANADQRFERFNEALKIAVPMEKKGEVLVSDARYLTFMHEDPQYGVEVVNTLLDLADRSSVSELAAEYGSIRGQKLAFLKGSIANKLALAKEERELRIKALVEENTLAVKNVQDQLEVMRSKAKMTRLDRIKILQEAIAIASSLNITMPTTLEQSSGSESERSTLVNSEVKNVAGPLYLRGTKFLSSELQTLQQRKDDDFADQSIRDLEAELELLKRNREVEMLKVREDDRAFITEEIQPLRSQIVTLEGQSVNFDDIHFVRMDQPATVPAKPIKPKKMLIVALAVVLGGMVGLLVAVVVPAGSVRREDS